MWSTGAPGLYVMLPGELSDNISTIAASDASNSLEGAVSLAQVTDDQGHVLYTLMARPFFPYPIEDLDWFYQCTQPSVPIPLHLVLQGTQDRDVRHVDFDCTSSWLYSVDNTGAYVLHRDLLTAALRPQDVFANRHLGIARAAFTNTKPTEEFPAFVIYDAGTGTLPLVDKLAYLQPASILPPDLDDAYLAPLALDGPLTYLGMRVYTMTESLEVETWWQVTQDLVERNFSIMAHLLDTSGENLGVADGLGVFPMTLRYGDVIVQRHRFLNVAFADVGWLRTGVYWLDNGVRLTIVKHTNSDAIFVPVGEGQVPGSVAP